MARGNGDEIGERKRGAAVPRLIEPERASVGRSLPTEAMPDSGAVAALRQFFELLDRWDNEQRASAEPRK